jgi:rhodanese-related sulfurtransferase
LAAARGDEKPAVSKKKQTILGFYVTAMEAYEKWKSDPTNVKILDVRTPEEYIYVGHPIMAWHIPARLQTHQWDADHRKLLMTENQEFLPQVKEVFKSTDTILVICRSGGRSAEVVNLLAGAGFQNAYTIIDGMEGDEVRDPESVFQGKRMKNGWKNSGLPWTYDLDPDKMRLPSAQKPTPTTKRNQ